MDDTEIEKLVKEYYPAFIKYIYKEKGYMTTPTVNDLIEWEQWKNKKYCEG